MLVKIVEIQEVIRVFLVIYLAVCGGKTLNGNAEALGGALEKLALGILARKDDGVAVYIGTARCLSSICGCLSAVWPL